MPQFNINQKLTELLNTKFKTEVIEFKESKKQDSSAYTTSCEKQIDEKVYELYGLTPEEIAIVEGR